jgi:5-methylcytosine-specific restriction endonuclease McrA
MTRSVPEWIGKTDDAKIPQKVLVRVFDRHSGMCHISGRRIRAGERWECDHVIALCNGGQHRESNLAPALTDTHKVKTAVDVAEKAKVYRKRAAHLGLMPAKQKINSPGFAKRVRTHAGRPPVRRALPAAQ